MKDKNTIKAEKLAEQEAQRKALSDLLEGLDLHKGRFSELLGIKSRGTVYTWLAAPGDGGVPIPGPVWRWVELLMDQPHMLGWLEGRYPERASNATPDDKRNRRERARRSGDEVDRHQGNWPRNAADVQAQAPADADSVMLAERHDARARKAEEDAANVAFHRRVLALLGDLDQSGAIMGDAKGRIGKWEQRGLCSPHYINAWRAIIELPVEAMAAEILRDDAEGIALRQNTPFWLAEEEAE